MRSPFLGLVRYYPLPRPPKRTGERYWARTRARVSHENLEEYRKKRHIETTPEPDDGNQGDEPRFVIQKHDASSLHHDFRLEADGVLKSWAVPKGPSIDPSEKRLALPTEDHPLDYIDFEGVIPGDEYRGGTVIVWDTGPFENRTTDDDGSRFLCPRASSR